MGTRWGQALEGAVEIGMFPWSLSPRQTRMPAACRHRPNLANRHLSNFPGAGSQEALNPAAAAAHREYWPPPVLPQPPTRPHRGNPDPASLPSPSSFQA